MYSWVVVNFFVLKYIQQLLWMKNMFIKVINKFYNINIHPIFYIEVNVTLSEGQHESSNDENTIIWNLVIAEKTRLHNC